MSTVMEQTGPTSTPPNDPPAAGGPPPGDRSSGRRGRALVVMAVVAAVLAGVIALVAANNDTASAKPYKVVAVTGAAQSVADGKDVIPSTIRLRPGQDLVLENGDFQPHTIGDLTAPKG